jgi:hypothetical protein
MMKLVAHIHKAEPWPIYDGTEDTMLGVTLEEAFAEAAGQTAADAGSDLLEEGTEECRELLAEQMRTAMAHALHGVGDHYRAPDGVLYTLEEK